MIKWWKRRKARKLRERQALRLLDWAEKTEMRVRSNVTNTWGETRDMYMRITIDDLCRLHKWGGYGTVGENFTIGNFIVPVEIYFAPKTSWGAYDK